MARSETRNPPALWPVPAPGCVSHRRAGSLLCTADGATAPRSAARLSGCLAHPRRGGRVFFTNGGHVSWVSENGESSGLARSGIFHAHPMEEVISANVLKVRRLSWSLSWHPPRVASHKQPGQEPAAWAACAGLRCRIAGPPARRAAQWPRASAPTAPMGHLAVCTAAASGGSGLRPSWCRGPVLRRAGRPGREGSTRRWRRSRTSR